MTPPLTAQDWLRLARRYYPPGVASHDPDYGDTTEIRSLQEAWREALAHPEPWSEFLQQLRGHFPTAQLMDATVPYQDACRRCCIHLGRAPVGASGTLTTLVACASVLAPVHLVYVNERSSRNGEAVGQVLHFEPPPALSREFTLLEEQFKRTLQTHPLPANLATLRVPDLSVGNVRLGHVTLRDALFTSAPDILP